MTLCSLIGSRIRCGEQIDTRVGGCNCHSFRIIDGQGLQLYRRVQAPRGARRDRSSTYNPGTRISTGVPGHVIDLTVPGCRLQSTLLLDAGESVQLRVQVEGRKPLRIDLGVVRWVQDNMAGIEFIRMSEEDQVRLRQLVGFVGTRPPLRTQWSEAPLCVGY